MPSDGRHEDARRLYRRALGLEPSQREAFLRTACGEDAALRRTVDELLSDGGAPTADSGTVAGEPPPDLSPGEAVQDRYRIEGRLGRGGMGVVYAAHDELLDRPVALKMLRRGALDASGRQRFLREARAAAALNHGNVVALFDAGEVAGRPFLVMEKVEGDSLEHRPPETLDHILAAADGVCAALAHAHERGLVHRDLKPANVLLDARSGSVKLTDMGIALARGGPRVTRPGAVAGTPTYMAPEQALGREVDARTDLYALGVMLYQWAVGRPPFEGDDALAVVSQHINAPVVPPRNLRPDLPASFERVVLRLLAKEPSRRFAAASEVREALAMVGRETDEETLGAAAMISGLAGGRMVGREAELDRLQSLWRETRTSGGRLVLVSGEPGVGKTRLARELVASVGLEGGLILSGGCYEHEATTPYLPFVEALRQFVRDAEDETLRTVLGDSAVEIARLAPEIASRLGPFAGGESLPPMEQRIRLFDHVGRFLARLARPRGLLLFLDDLQWADHGSVDLLHDLLRHLRGEPVLVLGTYRDVEVDPSHPLARALVDWERERIASRLPLLRLDRQATRSMLSALLDQEEISEELVLGLHRETEGNPFFVEEIVKAMVADGGLVRRHGGWERSASDEVSLPESLKSAIESRLDRLGEDCLRALRTAAVIGKDFSFERLAAIVDLGEDELLDLLDEASAAQIVVPARGESFAFTHDKIREVLHEELNPVRRRRTHRRIAETLLTAHERGDEAAAEDLAFHFIGAGDLERGLHFSLEAARSAAAVFAFDEALERLQQARECAEGLADRDRIRSVDETIGNVHHDRGDFARAARALESALEQAADPATRARLHVKIADTYLVAGDVEGREHARAALEAVAAAEQPAIVADATMIEGRYLHLAGDLTGAAAAYEKALDIAAEGPEDPELLIGIYANLSGTYQHLADYRASDAWARKCAEVGARHSLPIGSLMYHEFSGENAYYRGLWQEGVEHGETEQREAEACQAGARALWARFRIFSLHQLGRVAEAETLAHEVIAGAHETGDFRLEMLMHSALAVVLLDTGRVEEALATARAAVAEADASGLVNQRITARHALVRSLRRRGEDAEATDTARFAAELAETSGSLGLLLISGSVFAEALSLGDREAEVDALLERHREIAETTESPARLAMNRHVRGLVAA
ncbi:MAG: AAA family ATPase, partial [Thermoanaerobaculia bacterium]|nr:AAA family ATPase [Thermoanaerobaculia bacterium]